MQTYGKDRGKFCEPAYQAYLPLANQGDAAAQYYVGRLVRDHLESVGIHDPTEAQKQTNEWIEKSAANEFAEAQADVAITVINEKKYSGREYNKDRVYGYLHTAAEKDNVRAQTMLALYYGDGSLSKYDSRFKKNSKKSFQWWLRLANQGRHGAAMSLAEMYRDGRGVKKNLEEAMYWCDIYLFNLPTRVFMAHGGANTGSVCRHTIEVKLTKKQIAAARTRAEKWQPNPVDEDLKRELQAEKEEKKMEEESLKQYIESEPLRKKKSEEEKAKHEADALKRNARDARDAMRKAGLLR